MLHLLKDKSLPDDVLNIIRHQATERPGSGEYNTCTQLGIYYCRGCGAALFQADAKFVSSCGWPSFDAAIASAVKEQPDRDGMRIEINCNRCCAHLGHVFDGEGYTAKNRRYCVNSRSLDFVENAKALDTEEAIVAGGCFWGVQYYFARLPGVLKTEVGYTGGTTVFPGYQDVCTEKTGHYEAIRILYDPLLITYDAIIRYFFEIHDPTQANGQGPDHGQQYQSAVFYFDSIQYDKAQHWVAQLEDRGYSVKTQLLEVKPFWPAEIAHQHYYEKTGHTPYCHRYTKRF